MNPPAAITIDGDRIRIRRRRLGRLSQGYPIGGEYTKGNRTITLSTGNTRFSDRATFVHELCHAIYDLSDARLDGKTEEYVIDQLDSRLVHALRENPELVRWLLE